MADNGDLSRVPSATSTRRSSTASQISNNPPAQDATPNQSQSSSAHFGSASQSSDTVRRRPPVLQTLTESYGSINAPLRAMGTTSDGGSTPKPLPKKPGLGRRTTSNYLPHKGQEFSADDAEDEIGIELERQRLEKEERRAKMASGTLRRQPSTIRRRPTAQVPTLAKVDSSGDEGVHPPPERAPTPASKEPELTVEPPEEIETVLQPDESAEEGADEGADDLSDTESFTLKDRQDAINVTHPFGIRIWKPALYKKDRSVQQSAEDDVHSTPGGQVSNWLFFFNFLWTVLFGWWLALLCLFGALFCVIVSLFSDSCIGYGVLLLGLSQYLFYPFGKFVKLLQDEAYAEEDEGEGRSISEYEQWQSGDLEEGRLFFGPVHINRSLIGRRRTSVDSNDETRSLLGRTTRGMSEGGAAARAKRRWLGRGQWNIGRVIFFLTFYGLLTPSLLLVSLICWMCVFTIPMGKVTLLVFDHLRRHPLALSFHSESADTRYPGQPSSILVCTYRAVGSRYWKYTIDGTNIFLFNLLGVVLFTIVDFYVLDESLGLESWITSQGFIFALALFSIIPLAYFIGQAVASISAQSSMGVGATINAFFSTIVEVYLYCIALNEGKHSLVEGSIIGSIFAGILFLPGLSMCFGALKRKTQRFNVKSAGVTSTMLLFAMIGAFGPTLFYQIYGSHELKCRECGPDDLKSQDRDCRRCFFSQVPDLNDRFYQEAVLPYIYCSAFALFFSYVVGLLFTLRTHAAVIWTTDVDEKKHPDTLTSSGITNPHAGSFENVQSRDQGLGITRQVTSGSLDRPHRTDIRDSALYQRILGLSLNHHHGGANGNEPAANSNSNIKPADGQSTSMKSPHIVPPASRDADIPIGFNLSSLSLAENASLTRHVTEIAATAAAVAARDATRSTRSKNTHAPAPQHRAPHAQVIPPGEAMNGDGGGVPELAGHAAGGGHDAPNWSRTKSAIILMTATVAYAVIAEILVNTVDSVLDNVDIDEKFLGITLFALVPNTTEFLNAISFAMNGNIALSMEIGSAYALQVCLLQIPALVLYSAVYGRFIDPMDIMDHTFTLIFPQWDMVTVILCVFLLSYMYGEGKSNYFKGSILILSYLVVIIGFYFSSFNSGATSVMGVNEMDTLALGISPVSMRGKQGWVEYR